MDTKKAIGKICINLHWAIWIFKGQGLFGCEYHAVVLRNGTYSANFMINCGDLKSLIAAIYYNYNRIIKIIDNSEKYNKFLKA